MLNKKKRRKKKIKEKKRKEKERKEAQYFILLKYNVINYKKILSKLYPIQSTNTIK